MHLLSTLHAVWRWYCDEFEMSMCACVASCLREWMDVYNENPSSEWLEIWHSSSHRHCIAAYWLWGSRGQGLGLRMDVGLGLWFQVREPAPICISRQCIYLPVGIIIPSFASIHHNIKPFYAWNLKLSVRFKMSPAVGDWAQRDNFLLLPPCMLVPYDQQLANLAT